VKERTQAQRRAQSFEQCLLDHGVDLDFHPDQWLKAAAVAKGKDRLNFLTLHVIEVNLWTLAQREGTPCVPMILAFRCNKDLHCAGLGDRMMSLGSAFWLAMMTNSAFVLDLSRPVPLHEFLLPAADMIIPSYRACVENPALSSKRHRIVRQPNATANEEFFSTFNATDVFAEGHWVEVFGGNGGYAGAFRSNPEYQATLARMGVQHNTLADFLYIADNAFVNRPSPRLERMARPYLEAMDAVPATLRIGIHMRMGDSALANTFKQSEKRYKPGVQICWVRQAIKECNAVHPNRCVVWLASDDSKIAAEVTDDLIKAGIEVLAAPGESTHIDFVNSTNYEEQLEAAGKAYLDWYMLTQMEVLIMSRGGFSISAAHRGLPRRAMFLEYVQSEESTCRFKDYIHDCVGNVCPGQNSYTYPDAVETEWMAGDY
jgi:hypothetical protein